MKINQNKNHYKKLLFALALSLSACGKVQDKDALKEQGRAAARESEEWVHNQYFSCYTLEPNSKKRCHQRLAKKYIDSRFRSNEIYTTSFQFESEKLGFKHFLNNIGVNCGSITDGPIFIDSKKSYLVICKPSGKYLMQFDYEDMEWYLISEDVSEDSHE